ncbi:MAG: arginine--tRNA ligase, partial [Dehalococcoidia bacterium]|nr:arginine--tRNA ligase [Dehalococcoidia bacterium]
MPAPLLIETIQHIVAQALEAARQEGVLRLETIPEIQVERPGNSDHGDFATNLPLKLARATRINPLELAQSLAAHIATGDVIDRVEAAQPGFINFYLNESWLQQQVETVLQAGNQFGNTESGRGQKMMVEFVSVNPTGPVHVGHTRGAVLGSALANIMEAAGYDVTREYYVNDAGNQMQLFYRSVLAAYKKTLGHEAEMPEKGYEGEYIFDLAKEIADSEGTRFINQDDEQALKEIGDIGRERMVATIKEDLFEIGVEFDNWFSERTLFTGGEYATALGLLQDNDYLSERDGATWFNSTMLGDDKDNVVVRSNGDPTYFASDIAYHYNKFVKRGYDTVVDIWGADHQGHVPRMKSAVEALGIDRDRLTVLISQLVTLGERMSKRKGNFVTLKELVDEVGVDACRFFFLARTPSTQMDFDLELAKKESSENPVYYVQYAHARVCSVLGEAEKQGVQIPPPGPGEVDLSPLTLPEERALILALLRFPEIVESAALSLEPHRLTHYLMDLAAIFHNYYKH